jgi:hypothetical protein
LPADCRPAAGQGTSSKAISAGRFNEQ